MKRHLPLISAALLAAFLAVLVLRGFAETTLLLILSSLFMFAASAASAVHLLGGRATLRFVLIAVVTGWLAEQLGSSYGWFFGDYTYTEVLGPRVGDVPIVIPLMWFGLTYGAYVIANLIVWQAPVDRSEGTGWMLVLALLAALIVTSWDLAADPYFVRTLKAWIMEKQDGWWFGETLQGFVGWAGVSFAIILAFRLTLRRAPIAPALPAARRHVLVPLAIYGGSLVFQVALVEPVELRTVAFFALGVPLLAAACGLARWRATTPITSTSE
ncbi:putative membrane protein [Pseudoduganella flava]|uniref:Carotenoid biosynthesis protein n=1 Tax=Pseudoduganella flava TaxID=871742 RepID=A0A562Q0K5_9BURK|nr:carotenoid biosynthesis protein [Pseudoduganella flava]QGZ38580.1 carotenoid biosynthesis protein [Pseudoduganella flava]TWI49856.1 putative membrane protein [Pseudoduganella flava]